jgi:hypothetical protein
VEQELREFSYIVSHDLGASFRHLSEFARLLLGELGETLTDRQQAHAEHIRAASAKCQWMMEQLLAFSRLQQKTLERATQDATGIMNLAAMQLADEIEIAEAEVSIDSLGEVDADPALLILAFVHLLDNAIKFRRPDTRPRITIQAAHDDRTWRLQITDNGIGVEPLYRNKAFWMFHRLHGEDAYPGVGAGLALCRRIARRHGGEVKFLDCAEGACVELALPHAESRP